MRRILYFIIIVYFISCNPARIDHGGLGYLKDSTFTNFDGLLLDSNKYSFPIKYFNDSIWIETKIDSFRMNVYSLYLNSFKAPILYNYYLGYDNFRFLWIRSFHHAVLITLKKGEKISLNTKILKTKPFIWTVIYNPLGKDKGETIMTGQDLNSAKKEYPLADSIVLPNHKIKIALDTTCLLTKRQWKRFIELVDSCDFWKMEANKEELGIDGADWVLEGQNSNKYHFVIRWSPHGKYRRCCEYLIKISAAKNEKIY
jgi:hypothetical protein